ncbi:transcription repressor OFP8-like [Zingiber officinale]|uniref:Transcription repressor n=1 Tax=Zingiber officinale TaxID=94328 RepID=A0A8J5KHW0_ZINOF|nr:transcription repressor OFP8-like [Zingiber officinale]KAG6481774.1 hypothetical protein ZIOFF_058395 [Zingiber officinale]
MGTNSFRRRSSGLLSLRLGCGVCSDSKSVSVSVAKLTSQARTGATEESSADTTLTVAAAILSSSSSDGDEEETTGQVLASASKPASVSELLRQLGELEQSGAGWSGGVSRSENRGVEDSEVVVKETADPMGEFRRSMLHMIVEKEIVGGAELGELLRRFLALNSPQYHVVILRAFSEIWEDVFAGYERTPDLLRRISSNKLQSTYK